MISDGTCGAYFLLSDHECLWLLGKIANDLRHDLTKVTLWFNMNCITLSNKLDYGVT